MNSRIIRVKGQGRVATKPDIANLSFTIQEQQTDYAQCVNRLAERTEQLRRDLESLQIPRVNLKTTSFDVRVDTEYTGGKHRAIGFMGTHALTVQVPPDKDSMNQVFRTIVKGNSGAGIALSFATLDRESVHSQTLDLAVKNAVKNAQVLASAAQVTLGKLLEMDYGWAEVRIYDRPAGNVLMERSADMSAPIDIEPEDIASENTVTMTWEIAE